MIYERYLLNEGYDAVVTCGGVHSNHNRAMALMAMANGWRCHLIYHGDKNQFLKGGGNADLVKMSGATYEFVSVDGISEAMDSAMEKFQVEGLNPCYVHGGGHDMPGGIAYVEAIKELKRQCEKDNYKPNYIFVASGTGSMQAGMAVGLTLVGWDDVNLVGISIAREQICGKKIIVDFANMLAKQYGIDKDYEDTIVFDADYIGEGYDRVSSKENQAYLKHIRQETGLLLDETYSGKAMIGMMRYMEKYKVEGKVIFWLTGGPLNVKL